MHPFTLPLRITAMASFRPKNKFPLGHNLLDSIDTFSMPTGPYITLLERRRYPNDQTQVQIKIEASVKRRVLEDTIDNEYRSRTIDSKLPLADTSLTSYRVVQFAGAILLKHMPLYQVLVKFSPGHHWRQSIGSSWIWQWWR